jgi:hypothetical protein
MVYARERRLENPYRAQVLMKIAQKADEVRRELETLDMSPVISLGNPQSRL